MCTMLWLCDIWLFGRTDDDQVRPKLNFLHQSKINVATTGCDFHSLKIQHLGCSHPAEIDGWCIGKEMDASHNLHTAVATMSSVDFFEGVEKLLEIWFYSASSHSDSERDCDSDLRNIPRHELDLLVDDAQCKIISAIANDSVDSYLLSESSLFVSRTRFILKTCGTTTPLNCVKRLLGLVTRYTDFTAVKNLFYSRKNFRCPNLQETTYRSFNAEVCLLQQLFPAGSAYCMGRINADCWYLYTLNRRHNIVQHCLKSDMITAHAPNLSSPSSSSPSTSPSPSSSNSSSPSATPSPQSVADYDTTPAERSLANGVMTSQHHHHHQQHQQQQQHHQQHQQQQRGTARPDQTVEILMADLDPQVMALFQCTATATARHATQCSGIDKLLDNMEVDDKLFYPCGYSMNGLIDKDYYMTIHVTPQHECSYVSLETNVELASYQALIARAVHCFRPQRTLITVFANDCSKASAFVRTMSVASEPPYLVVPRDLQYSRLNDYHLLYAFYER